MAWETHFEFRQRNTPMMVNFDFDTYEYRASFDKGGYVQQTSALSLAPTGIYEGSVYRVILMTHGMPPAPLYLGMGTSERQLTNGANRLQVNTPVVTIERRERNDPPSLPGAFTSPAASSTLRAGSAITVRAGGSSDPEGGTVRYFLEAAYNGSSSYTLIAARTATPSWSYAVPSDSTLKSIRFRARAQDEAGNYSGYRSTVNFVVNHNAAPSTPGSFTSPASGTVLKGGQTISIVHGGSTDPDGDSITYEVEATFEIGEPRIDIVRVGAGTGSTWEVPSDKGRGRIQFRVRAKDPSGAYSGYRRSEVFDVSHNDAPTLELDTTNNRTLYESDLFVISGSARDVNSGDVATVRYQLNSEAPVALETRISNGSAFPFNRTLVFRLGKLYHGDVAVTGDLSEGSQHILRVWVEDDKGAKSPEQVRSFYVVPNRPANLSIEAFSGREGLIDSDVITLNGSVSDPDGGTLTVKYKVANGAYKQVYSGTGGTFSFQLGLHELATGANSVTVRATDAYGVHTDKVLSLTKSGSSIPLTEGVLRYKLVPPNGTTDGILLWIQREVGDLVISVRASMVMNGEAEHFEDMRLTGTAFLSDGTEEDEFELSSPSPKENIALEITMKRALTSSDKGITLISGVLN